MPSVPFPRPAYDQIGRTYTATRRADPRIARQIDRAIGPARSVLNVGAGSGNYEPDRPLVVGLEPSRTMLDHRPPSAAPAVQGRAEQIPFPDGSFEVAMGTLTLHHWSDLAAGLAEVRRVASRQVFLLFDRSVSHGFWVLTDYFPDLIQVATEAGAPMVSDLEPHLDVDSVEVVMVPADCTDGFGGAYWNRPEAYLDPMVRAGMSFTAVLPPERLAAGSARLAEDLRTGAWDERHGHLRELTEIDLGYRLVLAA